MMEMMWETWGGRVYWTLLMLGIGFVFGLGYCVVTLRPYIPY